MDLHLKRSIRVVLVNFYFSRNTSLIPLYLHHIVTFVGKKLFLIHLFILVNTEKEIEKLQIHLLVQTTIEHGFALFYLEQTNLGFQKWGLSTYKEQRWVTRRNQ